MGIKIIADSSCDTTEDLRNRLDIDLVPLFLTVPGHEPITDEIGIDTDSLLHKIESQKEPARTACPPIQAFVDRMTLYEEMVVITLSRNLSGTYAAACAARDMVLEKFPSKKILVLDSESASAGETLTALYVDSLRKVGELFDSIAEKAAKFVSRFRTLFVLEDLRTLVKNGRMSKVKGIVASVLSIHPILGDNGHGEIALVHTVRGLGNALSRLVDTIRDMTSSLPGRSTPLVLSHCQCPDRARDIRDKILSTCPAISEVTVVPTSGLSSLYASRGGLVLAFDTGQD